MWDETSTPVCDKTVPVAPGAGLVRTKMRFSQPASLIPLSKHTW